MALEGLQRQRIKKNLMHVNVKHDGESITMTTATGFEIRRVTFKPDSGRVPIPKFEINVHKKIFGYFLLCMDSKMSEIGFRSGFCYNDEIGSLSHQMNVVSLTDASEDIVYPDLEKVMSVDHEKASAPLSIGLNMKILSGLMSITGMKAFRVAVFHFQGEIGPVVIVDADQDIEDIKIKAVIMPCSVKNKPE